MNLKDYLSIGGEQGLFKFIAQGRNAIVVEHLETGKRSSAFGSAKVSSLEDIAIFTTGEDMPLSKIFDSIWEKTNGGVAIDHKSDNEALKSWFAEMVPDYDRERVYASDIRKVAHWYNSLHKLNLLVKEEEKSEGEAETEKPAAKPEKKKQTSAPKNKPSRSGGNAGRTESKSAVVMPKGAPKAK